MASTRHSRTIAAFSLLGLAALALSSAMGAGQARADSSPSGAAKPTTPIKHVIIIYQENHTFDDTLGAVCETRTTPCNGYTGSVTLADGKTAPNIVQPDLVPNVVHDPPSQQLGVDDKWDQIEGCTKAPYVCVSHVDPSRIPNLAALADNFAVSDATFAAGKSASFGAHVTLGAGTFDDFTGFNPLLSRTGHKPGPGWGCPSFRDVLWGPAGHHQYVPSCIPDQSGRGPYRKSPVTYRPTIMERMEQAKLSWHIYQGTPEQAPADTTYSFCTYFAWCLLNRFNLQHDSATNDFLAAAKKGTLPNLSVMIPMEGLSQHNGTSMSVGDNYIGSIVSAAENGPEWNSTAIFITYDDCGCFYDHVTPPDSMGLRNPMVIISPWAIQGYTDSTVAVQPYSMLAFVESNFALQPLSQQVSAAYDYSGSFDFSQQPLPGVPMTRTAVPRSELHEVARLAPMENRDPT